MLTTILLASIPFFQVDSITTNDNAEEILVHVSREPRFATSNEDRHVIEFALAEAGLEEAEQDGTLVCITLVTPNDIIEYDCREVAQ